MTVFLTENGHVANLPEKDSSKWSRVTGNTSTRLRKSGNARLSPMYFARWRLLFFFSAIQLTDMLTPEFHCTDKITAFRYRAEILNQILTVRDIANGTDFQVEAVLSWTQEFNKWHSHFHDPRSSSTYSTFYITSMSGKVPQFFWYYRGLYPSHSSIMQISESWFIGSW